MSSFSLYIAPSPHVFDGDSTAKIMWRVVAALAPATAWGVYAFGLRAAWIVVLCMAACVAFEAGAQALRGRPVTVRDGSAALTGLLLALNLPVSCPWWIVVLGGGVAILLGKHVFGGLGQNPFNPALVARVVLLISFPVQLTNWKVGGGRPGRCGGHSDASRFSQNGAHDVRRPGRRDRRPRPAVAGPRPAARVYRRGL